MYSLIFSVRPEVRACTWAGLALVLSGGVYGTIWAFSGGSLAGPLSLRKPILFGVSTGVTALSMGWALLLVPRRSADGWLYGAFALALVLEVALIDLQQARGVRSHYNHATPFDSVVTSAMGALILFATLCIFDLAVRAWRSAARASTQGLAAALGLTLLLLGCVIGIAIVEVGERQLSAGLPPEIYGDSGVLKFPHGLPLHGIQLFHAQAILLTWLGSRRPRLSLWAAATAVLLATVYGASQTWLGGPRFPPLPQTLPWVLATAAATILALVAALPRVEDRSLTR